MADLFDIQLLKGALDPRACIDFVTDAGAGGIVTFVGNVRDNTQGRRVVRLEFEAYAPMAISEMRKIAERARQQWPVKRIAMHHRVGALQIGETAVVIALATPHRREAFAACQFAIDTLKETVPIWKKEIFEDGAVWVAAHP